ncbi:hypothetical protein PFISCL1PPCAC_18719 [Pristionchus fissidentatus]|uniref:Uncharacterized protein n=1 Tax=Pristionchus fissidentatus TaxID=1538716 RepID=A0AAV5W8V1_9BILA|nr:hypothetical protein PFISCL1PPCAC_18719 [Pristionchus fissidentatus]
MVLRVLYILYAFELFYLVDAWYRSVDVKGRFGCIDKSGDWIPLKGSAVLYEYDGTELDPHDLKDEVNLEEKGRFHLHGSEFEISSSPRFFIGFWVQCKDENKCADPAIRERCAIRYNSRSMGRYSGPPIHSIANMFTHRFEYSRYGEENVQDTYELDCTIGFKSNTTGETIPGLSCSGSLCPDSDGRCSFPTSFHSEYTAVRLP